MVWALGSAGWAGAGVTLAPVGTGRSAYGHAMSLYMAWPTADGVWHIGTWLTLQPGASLADLNELLRLHHIERVQIGFHRPDDETKFNEQFAIGIDQRGH